MKEKFKKLTAITLITLISIPTMTFAATKSLELISGQYALSSGNYQYMQYDEDTSSMVYQKSSINVQNMVADSGSGSCTWCHMKGTLKKKVLLGVYSTIDSKSINTPTTGQYTIKNHGNVGTGTFRFYIKNEDHQYNSGSVTVKIQDSSFN